MIVTYFRNMRYIRPTFSDVSQFRLSRAGVTANRSVLRYSSVQSRQRSMERVILNEKNQHTSTVVLLSYKSTRIVTS